MNIWQPSSPWDLSLSKLVFVLKSQHFYRLKYVWAYMVRRFLLILFCYLPTVLVYGQLDTTRVLEGDWTLNSFSCKKSYDYKDTNNGFTNVDDYKLWLTIGNKKAELTSTTVFSFLNDSTVSV